MIAVVADTAKGGNFLAWSLYYLSGCEKYYSTKEDKLVTLIDNPLTNLNSHKFYGNQPSSINDFWNIYEKLAFRPGTNVMYFHPWLDAQEKLALNTLQKSEIKIIALINQEQNALYDCRYARRAFAKYNIVEKDIQSDDMWFDEFVDKFFSSEESQTFSNIWDKREFCALNFEYHGGELYNLLVDGNINHLLLDTLDMWNFLDRSIIDILNYVNLPLNNDRFIHWKQIYNQWRDLHYNNQRFIWYFNIIIKNILNGVDQDLTKFNLDILQEAYIQKELLYKHNLALKTYGVEKFLNTKQLHALLEPNIYHKLS